MNKHFGAAVSAVPMLEVSVHRLTGFSQECGTEIGMGCPAKKFSGML